MLKLLGMLGLSATVLFPSSCRDSSSSLLGEQNQHEGLFLSDTCDQLGNFSKKLGYRIEGGRVSQITLAFNGSACERSSFLAWSRHDLGTIEQFTKDGWNHGHYVKSMLLLPPEQELKLSIDSVAAHKLEKNKRQITAQLNVYKANIDHLELGLWCADESASAISRQRSASKMLSEGRFQLDGVINDENFSIVPLPSKCSISLSIIYTDSLNGSSVSEDLLFSEAFDIL